MLKTDFVNFTDSPSVKQDSLRKSSFSRVNMSWDTNVSNFIKSFEFLKQDTVLGQIEMSEAVKLWKYKLW